MAKKTLKDILKCPTDFLYLWASDNFISQLGNKAQIIREKKYNQYQSLWKTMVENTDAKSSADLQKVYDQWVDQIASEIKKIYGLTPAQILQKLAMGEDVLGKNWSKGVYGIGNTQLSFDQTPGVFVEPTTGKIWYDQAELPNQTPIYGNSGEVTGYTVVRNGKQYQSYGRDGKYQPYSYSDENGVQTPTGAAFDPTKSAFWQNSANYMPLIEKILSWIMSFFNIQDRVVLKPETTVPKQTEWVEEDGNGGLMAGGLLLAGLLFVSMDKPKGKKKK